MAAIGPVLLGIDVGTTETKAVATSPEGQVLAIGSGATPWRATPRGGAEIAPSALLDGVLAACANAVEQAVGHLPSMPTVRSVGVTSIAESGVLLGPQGRPTDTPIIAWFDPRGIEEFRALDRAFLDDFTAHTGLPVSPVSTFAKLLWLRAHAGLDLAGHTWLNVAEYVLQAWGANPTTEPSLASRTGLTDQDDLRPYGAALDVLGAAVDLLPPLVHAGTPIGTASRGVPPWLAGAVLTVAGHDHPVASLAAGATGPNDLFDSCGTAEALLRVTEARISREQRTELSRHNVSQGAHPLPGRRLLLGGTRGGLLLKRTLAMLGVSAPQARAELDAACPTGEVDLPIHVDGGRLDEQAVWLRIDRDDVTPALVWRAALDAAAYQAQRVVDAFDGVVGPAERMVAAGGWTRSPAYRAIKRRHFPRVTFSDIEQAGGVAAAAVAGFAAEPDTSRALPAAIDGFMDVYASSVPTPATGPSASA